MSLVLLSGALFQKINFTDCNKECEHVMLAKFVCRAALCLETMLLCCLIFQWENSSNKAVELKCCHLTCPSFCHCHTHRVMSRVISPAPCHTHPKELPGRAKEWLGGVGCPCPPPNQGSQSTMPSWCPGLPGLDSLSDSLMPGVLKSWAYMLENAPIWGGRA